MSVIKGVLLTLVSFFLVVSLVLSTVLLTSGVLLHPDIYLNTLEENDLSGALRHVANGSEEGERVNISSEEINTATGSLIDNLLSYLRGDSDRLNLTINLNSSTLKDVLAEQVEGLPVCLPGEQQNSNSESSICRPADKSPREFLDEILENGNITIPEGQSVDLAEVYGIENNSLEQARSYIGTYKTVRYTFLFLVLFFSGLIFVISRNLRKGSMILGIDIFLAGVLALMTSLIASSLINIPEIGFEFLVGIILSIKDFLISRQNTYSIMLMTLGGVLIGISFFLRKEDQKNQAKPLK